MHQQENLGVQPVNWVLRQLKRQEHSLFNCVASVVADADFVCEVNQRIPATAHVRQLPSESAIVIPLANLTVSAVAQLTLLHWPGRQGNLYACMHGCGSLYSGAGAIEVADAF